MNPKMRVLVAGGAGYIGGAVTDVLTRRSIPFTVYDSLVYEHQYLKPVDFISGDIRDTEKLGKLLPHYTHVIWLAALVGDGACQVNPALTIEINQKPVEWLATHYNGRIIFTSTCSVYGKNNGELDESTPPNPLSLYAITKVAGEKALEGKNALSIRLGTVYGMSDTYSRLRMDLVVNYMTANALEKKKLSVFGGEQWRPLIHVRNVAEALVNALDSTETGVFNVAYKNYQMRDLGKEVAELTGAQIEYVDIQFQDQRNYHVSTKKAETAGLLKFEKTYSIKDGSQQIADAITSGRIKYTENDIYFNVRHVANLEKNGGLK